MKALRWFGAKNVRVEDVPAPTITDPTDVVLRVTGTTVCGSDLHLYHKEIIQLQEGDILGHEFCGIVDEVGPGVTKFKKGDRVVSSFQVGFVLYLRSLLLHMLTNLPAAVPASSAKTASPPCATPPTPLPSRKRCTAPRSAVSLATLTLLEGSPVAKLNTSASPSQTTTSSPSLPTSQTRKLSTSPTSSPPHTTPFNAPTSNQAAPSPSGAWVPSVSLPPNGLSSKAPPASSVSTQMPTESLLQRGHSGSKAS